MNSPTSPSRSDAVLLRCRDTIERLQTELEDERFHRRELQQQVHALNNEMQTMRTELETEHNGRLTAEASNARLDRHMAELEAKVQAQRQSLDNTSESAQKAKAEAVQKAQELFARGLRVTELEGTVQRAEARATAAHAEVERFTQELRSVSERLVSSESEVSQLRATAEAEVAKVERLTRQCEERERRCEALQRELDEARISVRSLEDTNRVQLLEVRARQEQLVSQVRERERSAAERASEAELASSNLTREAADLRQRAVEAEAASTRHEQRNSQLEVQLQAVEVQLQAAQTECGKIQMDREKLRSDREKVQEELLIQTTSIARVETELEATRHQAKILADERKEAQDKCLHALAELSQMRHRVEESQRRFDDHENSTTLANAELKAQAEDELRRLKAQAEEDLRRVGAEMHRVEAELHRTQAELRDVRAQEVVALQESRAELKQQQLLQDLASARSEIARRTDEIAFARSEIARLTEAAEAESAKSRAAIRTEQDKVAARDADITNLSALLAESQKHAAEVQRLATDAEEACLNAEAREARCQAKLQEVEWRLDQTATRVREEATEASAAAIARVRDAEAMAEVVSKSMEDKVQRLRHRYEHKMTKMYRHLSERDAYEQKLKSLIHNEVDVLHQYSQELDGRRWWRSERYEMEDALTDRMKGMMDKVERRLTRKLRHM